jgi:hypothetical protein
MINIEHNQHIIIGGKKCLEILNKSDFTKVGQIPLEYSVMNNPIIVSGYLFVKSGKNKISKFDTCNNYEF